MKATLKKKIKKISLPDLIDGDFSEFKNAKTVLKHANSSVNRFYELFQDNRKGAKGGTTHVEQDLLRAMLLFSCSGLDAAVKQLVKDSLVKVIDKELGAQQEFQKFVERRIKKGDLDEKEKTIFDTNWVANVLASPDPRKYLMDALQKNLTDDSLQSVDQLLKVAAHFTITKDALLNGVDITKKAFKVRNEIIHEMDTDLASKKQGQKKRRTRGELDMVKYSENILSVGVVFINTVQKNIHGTS